jgi:RNA polymerase sigma factor (sigma-70 family)
MEADTELLQRFANDDDADAAFAELVRRKIGLVYAAARRQTGEDAHLARDVTQAVFLALAARAPALRHHAALTSWLFTTTRFLAHKAVRSQRRWQQREKDANAMNVLAREADPAWEQLRPTIDAALHELGERDREAILLRFFEGRTFAEVGTSIGLAENAARMRVERALEKLRVRLARHGITSSGAALALTLAQQPVVAIPSGLAAIISAGSLASAALRGTGMLSAWAALDFMTKLKITSAAVMAFASVASGTYLIAQQARDAVPLPAPVVSPAEFASLQNENQQLKAETARLQAALTAAGPSPLADLQVLVAAVQQRLIPPLNTLRTNKGELAAPVARWFKLTPAEKAALESSLDTTRRELNALSAAHVVAVERRSPTSVVIRIKPFAEEGGKIHDRFVGELTKTLGPERYTAMKQLTGDQFERQTGSGFGAMERTLIIERRAGQAGVPAYAVTDRMEPPPGTFQSISAIYALDRAGLERDYAAFMKLLPEDL